MPIPPLTPESSLALYREHVLNGVGPSELAVRFGLSPARVRAVIATVEGNLVRDHATNLDALRVRQTQRLEMIYYEAIAAFQRSRQDSTTKRTVEGETKLPAAPEGPSRRSSGGGPKVKVETATTGHSGDPKYLAVARAALADIRQIWSLDGHMGQATGSDRGTAVDFEGLADEDLAPFRAAHSVLERVVAGGVPTYDGD